jgi:hypothetical protein
MFFHGTHVLVRSASPTNGIVAAVVSLISLAVCLYVKFVSSNVTAEFLRRSRILAFVESPQCI